MDSERSFKFQYPPARDKHGNIKFDDDGRVVKPPTQCRVEIGYEIIGGRIEPTEIYVKMSKGRVLTASLFREMGLGEFIDRGRRDHRRHARAFIQSVEAKAEHAFHRQTLAATKEARIGRPPLSLDRIGEVASVYREADMVGGKPVVAVMEHFDVPRATANRWIRRAKDSGLIPHMAAPTHARKRSQPKRRKR